MVRNAADAIIPDTNHTIALCSSHVVRATVRVSAVAKYDHTPPPRLPPSSQCITWAAIELVSGWPAAPPV